MSIDEKTVGNPIIFPIPMNDELLRHMFIHLCDSEDPLKVHADSRRHFYFESDRMSTEANVHGEISYADSKNPVEIGYFLTHADANGVKFSSLHFIRTPEYDYPESYRKYQGTLRELVRGKIKRYFELRAKHGNHNSNA